MQTLTIPASISKRKLACKSCRQRKKRCDAEHPSCSLCRRWNLKCEYALPKLSRDNYTTSTSRSEQHAPASLTPTLSLDPTPQASANLVHVPEARLPASVALDIPYPTPESAVEQLDNTLDFQTLESFQLPPQHVTVQLVELFFEHLYHTFPCFHKKSFLAKLETGSLEKDAPLLLYAICCVAARHHPDQSIQKRSRDWYEQARFSYELTRRKLDHPLHTVQAVSLLVFHAWTIGDYSASWLFIGKVWRQAVVLGLNRMDASDHPLNARVDDENSNVFGKSEAHSVVEREEYRRALWLLFIMDRMNSWPSGWPNAIPEIQFKVDIPIADTLFQNMDPDLRVSPFNNLPFTRNLSRLIDSAQAVDGPLNVFHYVIVAHVLLGRVSELRYSLHNTSDSPEYAEDCTALDNMIVKFRLSLPRPASSILEASPADRGHVVWLHVILDTMAILLHYQSNASFSVQEAASKFTLVVIAARNIAQIVRDASRISIDLLLSAHIGSALYLAAAVLVIQWRLTGDSSFKEDIDLFALVYERMNEVFSFLGLKLKLALEHDLQKSVEELQKLRERGFKGMLADCTKWDHVREEVLRRGIEVDLS